METVGTSLGVGTSFLWVEALTLPTVKILGSVEANKSSMSQDNIVESILVECSVCSRCQVDDWDRYRLTPR